MTSLRYAFRSLAKSPLFVAISILALGLGLGLSTTMFAVLDAVVNPHVPYREPDQLFAIRWWAGWRRTTMTPRDLFNAVRDETQSFASVVPQTWDRRLLEETDMREVTVTSVTPAYFATLGTPVEHGRLFTEGDGDGVALVSAGLWRTMTGSRRFVADRTVTLSGRTYTVIGVMPRGFEGSVWIPLPPGTDARGSASRTLTPLARLKPGVTLEQAAQELRSLARLLTDRHEALDGPFHFELVPVLLRQEMMRDIHKAMVGSALVVLIIACVNLAHLMLARGLAKRRELALRMALGASRAVVVRQMFTECLIITLGGAGLGAVVALWGADVLTNRVPPEVSWVGLVQPQLSWRVFALSALAATASAIVFGLVPAIRVALDVDVIEPLKDGAGTTGRLRHRYSPLVILETALALVLLMGGGLLLRTVQQLQRPEPGVQTNTLLRGWAQGGNRRLNPTAIRVRPSELLAAARHTPGVLEAALRGGGREIRGNVLTAEMIGDSTRTIETRYVDVVSPAYLRVLGLPILRGRDFEPGDAVGNGVAILDAAAAARLYPGQEAVGKMIKLGAPAGDAPWVLILGVARSPLAERGSNEPTRGRVWLVQAESLMAGELLVRTASTDPRIAGAIRRNIRQVPGVTFVYVERHDAWREATLASRRFLAKMFVSMGGVALALAALGLYGVLAYAVGQRMREFAVRIALGAEPRQLFRMVLHDGAVMLLAGTGIGAFVALATTKYLDAVIEVVFRTDVWSLVGAEAVLIAVGLAAALGPARRAVKANPLDILRAV